MPKANSPSITRGSSSSRKLSISSQELSYSDCIPLETRVSVISEQIIWPSVNNHLNKIRAGKIMDYRASAIHKEIVNLGDKESEFRRGKYVNGMAAAFITVELTVYQLRRRQGDSTKNVASPFQHVVPGSAGGVRAFRLNSSTKLHLSSPKARGQMHIRQPFELTFNPTPILASHHLYILMLKDVSSVY